MPERPVHLGGLNHLFLLPGMAVRGTVFPCRQRLSDHLRTLQDTLLEVRDAEVCWLRDDAREECRQVHLRLDRLLLAHEYVDLGGDRFLRDRHVQQPTVPVTVGFTGEPDLRVTGQVRADALQRRDRFMALTDPHCVTEPQAVAYAGWVHGLPYLLVNRDSLAVVLLPRGVPQAGPEDLEA